MLKDDTMTRATMKRKYAGYQPTDELDMTNPPKFNDDQPGNGDIEIDRESVGEIKELLKNCQRRLTTILSAIDKMKCKDNSNINYVRCVTKASFYRTIIAELNKVQANLTIDVGSCGWDIVQDYDDEYYETDCGQTFCMTDGTLKENSHKYCQSCGKEIKLKEAESVLESEHKNQI